jgi:two-component system, cell cycle response regulator DivK
VSNHRVLYVEDDDHNFLLVKRTLEVLPGVEVFHAATAQDGLESARSEIPDLILMDVQLPGMDGLELTRELKKDQALQNVPVMALTANVMKGEKERALEAGCAEFVPKPFNLQGFRQLVARYLGL